MRWYALSKTMGIATLCADEADAQRAALEYDRTWPRGAPHVATRLVPVDDGLLAEIRGYLIAAADGSMSRNNSEQLAYELLERIGV